MSHDPSDAFLGGIFGAMMLLYVGIFILSILSLVFWVVEIIDVARRQFADPNAKIMWLLVVILLHGIGALVYYFVGKPQGWMPWERPLAAPIPQPAPMTPRDPNNTWPPPPGSSY